MGQYVEPAAVGHPDDHLARSALGGEDDRLVEHRHRHVEALDRELLLAQVGLVHEAFERVDRDQALEHAAALLVGERLAEGAALDPLPQPDALAVAGDVLDLVGQRAGVDLAQEGKRLGEVVTRDVDPQDLRRDAAHHRLGEVDGVRVQRRVPDRLGAERVEPGGEVAVRAEGLDQRRGGLDRLHQLHVVAARCGSGRGDRGWGGRLWGRPGGEAEVGE